MRKDHYRNNLVENFDDLKKKNLSKIIKYEKNEFPIYYDIFLSFGNSKKLMITNYRFLILDNIEVIYFEIKNSTISKFTIVERAYFKREPNQPKHIEITTNDQEKIILRADSSEEVSWIHNYLVIVKELLAESLLEDMNYPVWMNDYPRSA
jgi:hypothetical protein